MTTLLDILKEGRRQFPKATAFKIKPRYRSYIWNYSQFYNFATGIAKLLEEKKLKKGDRILLLAPNSPYWLGAFFGCLLKGIIVVPLYLQNRPKFVLDIAKKTQAKLLLKSGGLKTPAKLNLPFIDIDYLDEFIEKEHLFKKVPINELDIVQILYTSGTTGFPKGVVLTHKSIVSDLKAIFNIIKVEKSDKFLSILPLSHVFEQIVDFRALAGGAQIVFAPALGSTIIARTLFENKITKMAAVPEFLKLVMSKIEKRVPAPLFKIVASLPRPFRRLLFKKVHQRFGGKLNLIVSGGAPLDVEVGRKWQALGINILQGYGLTETSPVITVTPPPFKKIASVGKVVPGVKVKIAKDSEILVKGPIVFKEYWRDPKKTKEAFTDSWLKTGDMGYFDKKGFLYIQGRKKFMILTAAGQNVYPEDIEFELNKEKGVENSCVVGLPKRGKIEIHAVLLGKIKEPEKVIDRVNKRLASFQQIQSWSIWPFSEFPITVTKKVKRNKVLEYLTQKIVPEEIKATKKEFPPLVEILSTITSTNPGLISKETQVVKDLGLDSLMRIELVAQIEEEFGVEIDEAKITPETKVKDLEKLIKEMPKRVVKHKISFWQLSSLTKIKRKILQKIFVFPLLGIFSQIKTEGEENLRGIAGPVIFMPNHTSCLDSPSAIRALPLRFRENIALATAPDVLYERYRPLHLLTILFFNSYPFPRFGQIKSGLEHTGELIDRGWSILFFPEGRESRSGKMLPLKRGAGIIAVEMQVPVVPVKIEGARDIIPSGRHFPRKRGRVLVKFGQPLYFKKWDNPDKAVKTIERAIKNL
jgi:long-chain acyl-CoA synthetase